MEVGGVSARIDGVRQSRWSQTRADQQRTPSNDIIQSETTGATAHSDNRLLMENNKDARRCHHRAHGEVRVV